MATRGLTAMSGITRVESPSQAIGFTTSIKAWCLANGFPWWYACAMSEHHSDEARAKDLREKTRAQLLGHMKQAEIDGYLGLSTSYPDRHLPSPSRLDMMEATAHEASPESHATTSPPPTTSRTPDAVRGMRQLPRWFLFTRFLFRGEILYFDKS